MAFVRRRLLGVLEHSGDDPADIVRAGEGLYGGFGAYMAFSEHIRDTGAVKADPGIGPGILRVSPVEHKRAGSDQEILILIDYIVRFVIVKVALSVKHKMEDVVMADDRSVRLVCGTFFISAGQQVQFFGACLMDHHLFFFHKLHLHAIYNIGSEFLSFDFDVILL